VDTLIRLDASAQVEAADAVRPFRDGDGRWDAPNDSMHGLVDEGASVVVCTLVADGTLAVHFEHRERRVAASTVERIVDTNGAGDGFLAGLFDASLDGADLARAWRATN